MTSVVHTATLNARLAQVEDDSERQLSGLAVSIAGPLGAAAVELTARFAGRAGVDRLQCGFLGLALRLGHDQTQRVPAAVDLGQNVELSLLCKAH